MVRVGVGDAFMLALVVSAMVTIMATIITIIATDMVEPDIPQTIQIGLTAGVISFVLVASLALMRLRNLSINEKNPAEIKRVELERTQAILAMIEDRGPTDAAGEPIWQVSEKVFRERGVLNIDLHGLDPPSAAALTERLLERRSDLRRLRLITGRGESHNEDSADPGIRPIVLQILQIGATRVDWQVIIRSSSVVLRLMGIAPTPRIWIGRFVIYSIPITGVMGLAFQDLAGNGVGNQGLYFGIGAGLLMTALVASHRDRRP